MMRKSQSVALICIVVFTGVTYYLMDSYSNLTVQHNELTHRQKNLFETDQEIKYRKRNQLQPSTQHRNVRDQGLSIKLFNISHVKLNDAMNVWEVEQTYHRSVREIDVSCPISERMGNKKDGGWNVCKHPSYTFQAPCLVYSFGINNDWSFDDHVANTYNCTVKAFDPSMNDSDHLRGSHIWFFKIGISGKDKIPDPRIRESSRWKLETLTNLVRMFNDTDKIIDYLKIDVEYAEWDALETLIQEHKSGDVTPSVLSNTKQLGIELHTREMYYRLTSVQDYSRFMRILSDLHAIGFRRWNWSKNEWGLIRSKAGNDGTPISCCYEMVFININYL